MQSSVSLVLAAVVGLAAAAPIASVNGLAEKRGEDDTGIYTYYSTSLTKEETHKEEQEEKRGEEDTGIYTYYSIPKREGQKEKRQDFEDQVSRST